MMPRLSASLGPVRALATGLLAVACGGGGPSPSGPSEPPVPTYSVTATVFYEQNANGQLDANENTRVPGVEIVIGTGTGRSAPGTGIATVTGIREGALTAAVRTESLPTYFQPPPPAPLQVPGAATGVRIPLTLPIGGPYGQRQPLHGREQPRNPSCALTSNAISPWRGLLLLVRVIDCALFSPHAYAVSVYLVLAAIEASGLTARFRRSAGLGQVAW